MVTGAWDFPAGTLPLWTGLQALATAPPSSAAVPPSHRRRVIVRVPASIALLLPTFDVPPGQHNRPGLGESKVPHRRRAVAGFLWRDHGPHRWRAVAGFFWRECG